MLTQQTFTSFVSCDKMNERKKLRRLYSYPPRFSKEDEAEIDETGFCTANPTSPVSVPLDKVQIGSIKYVSSDWNDIEVLYELESDILIKTNIEGENGELPGTYKISGVSAADLSLHCVVPGSLESMVSRLVLELEDDLTFEPVHPVDSTSLSNSQDAHSLKSRIIKMSASAHEAGHFRDILLFLKCENIGDLSPELASPFKKLEAEKSAEELRSPKLTFLDFLPFWVFYIPWWIYSRKARTTLQKLILIYYTFTVLWAFWQLYRHVYVIQYVLEPVIDILRVYLAFLIEYFDRFFALFTQLWHRYLSPLNVLFGVLIAPIAKVALQLRTVFTPLVLFVTQCLKNSTPFIALKSLFSLLYQVASMGWEALLSSFVAIVKPFSGIWRALLDARVAVPALDFQRLRLSWVFSMVTGSVKAIGKGLAWLVGYTWNTKKRKKAIQQVSQNNTPAKSVTPNQSVNCRKRTNMPVYYNSPLSKQS